MITYRVTGMKNGGSVKFDHSTKSRREAIHWHDTLVYDGYSVIVTPTGTVTNEEREQAIMVLVLVACIIGFVLLVMASIMWSRRNAEEIRLADSFLMEVQR
jgi:hypothetical protein